MLCDFWRHIVDSCIRDLAIWAENAGLNGLAVAIGDLCVWVGEGLLNCTAKCP